jgi:hypothetical protein
MALNPRHSAVVRRLSRLVSWHSPARPRGGSVPLVLEMLDWRRARAPLITKKQRGAAQILEERRRYARRRTPSPASNAANNEPSAVKVASPSSARNSSSIARAAVLWCAR